ncbi:MAG: DUF481 domain-containing protein [Mariniblastus sp.]|nr:DUF481 domain-containing protein [Mariniblastus sp.]
MKRSTCLFAFLILTYLVTPLSADLNFGLSEGVLEGSVDANPWTGSFAFGLNGKSGNSTNLDINMTVNAARETEVSKTTLLGSYFYSSNDIATVTDRFFGQARQERKLAQPRLSIFYQGQYDWDRFKAYDYRLALHGGLGFEVFKLDDHSFDLRFGAGASKEFGTLGSGWIPELQFGGDWKRQLTDTVKVFASFDYYPNVEDFTDFRFVTNAGLEFVVDAERNINFRMFALDRFDSTPVAGNKDNDIDYGIAVVLGF